VNTKGELEFALHDYRTGTFIKVAGSGATERQGKRGAQ
jgi:hypothetical protein